MIHDAVRGRLPALVACAALLALGGCTTPSRPQTLHSPDGSFAAQLRACQDTMGGRLAHRRSIDASQPRVAACLRRRGWGPDGTPSIERLRSPG